MAKIHTAPVLDPSLLSLIGRADLIQMHDELAAPDYVHMPDEHSRRDDVVVEVTINGEEESLTLDELASAQAMGEGLYFIPKKGFVRFLQVAVIH